MLAAPALRGGTAARSAFLLAGLALFALGIVLLLEAELGLSPWDVLNQGVSERTPLSFGMANVAVALVVLGLARLLGARIGAGTVANAVLVGLFVDAYLQLDVITRLSESPLGPRVAMLAGGILVIGVASALYIGANMGAGPRDSLMLVLSSRTRRRVGVVRAGLEIGATGLGFALGGTVGVGTLAFAFGVGPAVETAFRVVQKTPLAEGEVASAA